MLNLKHTICPSCSTGCGITLISNNKELLGTYPYKRHEINEGKNCKNGRYCFTKYSFNKIDEPSIVNNGKLNESDFFRALQNRSAEAEKKAAADQTAESEETEEKTE